MSIAQQLIAIYNTTVHKNKKKYVALSVVNDTNKPRGWIIFLTIGAKLVGMKIMQ